MISDEWITKVKAKQPELRTEKLARYLSVFGLPEYDAQIITGHKKMADLFEETTALCGKPKKVSNWIMVETMRLLKECEMDADDLMMIALDAGAEDLSEEDDSYEIITAPEDFSQVRESLEKEGIKMAEAELTMIPQNYVDIDDPEVVKKFTRIIDMLEEDDDVQAEYHNANLPEEDDED